MDMKLKVTLEYIVSLKPVWASEYCGSNNHKEEEDTEIKGGTTCPGLGLFQILLIPSPGLRRQIRT